jgi:hypothetical protein
LFVNRPRKLFSGAARGAVGSRVSLENRPESAAELMGRRLPTAVVSSLQFDVVVVGLTNRAPTTDLRDCLFQLSKVGRLLPHVEGVAA